MQENVSILCKNSLCVCVLMFVLGSLTVDNTHTPGLNGKFFFTHTLKSSNHNTIN
jgi:hypothetical protein